MLKNLQLHVTKILLTTAFLLMGVMSWGQGSESFSNLGSSSGSYSTRTWTGDDGIGWTANDARTDQSLNGKAIALRTSILTNTTTIGGIGTLSFKYARVFSGNSTLKVYVNNVQYGSNITVSNTIATTFSVDVNITGDVTIKLVNSGGNRTIIDDISWTAGAPAGPSVTTEAVSDVDTDLAILNGSITNGDATAVSFEYGTTTSYGSTEAGDPATVTGDAAFEAIVSLDVNTQYHYRAVAGTELGDDVAFWTLAAVPTTPVASNVSVTTADITIGAADGNPATTQYAIYELWNDVYVQSDGTLGATAVWHTATEWSAITVNGLTAETEYAFYTKARNGANVETTESADGAEIETLPNTAPTTSADALTAFGDICINTTATTSSFGLYGENLTTANVVVTAPTGYTLSTTTDGTYTTTLTYTADGAGELLEEVFVRFTPTVVQSYNDNITITGGGTSATTNVAVSGTGVNTGATVATSTASDVATASATLGGDVTDEGCATVTARGVVIGTSSSPVIDGSGVTNYTAVAGGSGTYTVSVTGLSSSTQYYARAYATSAGGTVYGNDVTFTTLCGEFTLPFSEDFEDATFPANCWSTFRGTNNLGTSEDWKRITSDTYNGSEGTAYVQYENVSGGLAEDWLVTPGIVLPETGGTIELKFQESQDYSSDYDGEYYIKIATSNPTDHNSYTTVINYGESDFSNSYSERTVDLTAYEGQTVYVAFVMQQDDGDNWYIDDISITEVAPPLYAPVATAATSITTTGFTANWNAVDDATSYRLDVTTQTEGTDLSDLIISEYVEGDNPGNNKAIEIYNGTGSSVDLSQYAISRGNDTKYLLSGTLANGATYVVASNGASAATLAAADVLLPYSSANTAVYFTGSEDVNLYKNFILIDKVGAGNEDVTLRRKATVMGPSTSYSNSEWDSYPVDNVDDLGSHTSEGGTTTSFVTGYEDLNVGDVTSYEVTGLEDDTDYKYVVRAVSVSETSANSNEIEVTTAVENVWNGDAWTAGSAPAIIDAAIIEGAYNTAEDGTFTAATLIINEGGSLVIASGDNITITGAVVNNIDASAFIVENNANLIQVNNVENTGDIQVQKNSSALYRLDYSLWSAPVTGQNLLAFSPQTLTNRFYDYDESTDLLTAVTPGSNNFQPGYGYLIRMPNNHVSFVNEETAGETWTGTFEGTPNNGTVTVPMESAFNGYNLVGNPYPSPVNIAAFYAANSGTLELGSALYFWRKRNNPDATTYASITLAAYIANSAAGGDTGSGTFTGISDEWVINQGQGFFVKATGGSLVFNNAMRMPVNNNQFFRTTEEAQQQSSRLWLNLVTEGKFSQTAIVYNPNTTLDLDYGWDGKSIIGDGPVTIYTMAQDITLAIQARPEFDTEDQVALGIYVETAGNYTISLDHVDGLFTEGQDVYLKDNVAGQTINLKAADYTFSTEAGQFNERFEIIYTIQALDSNDFAITPNEVVVYQTNSDININAGILDITAVSVYDMRGRTLYSNNDVNASELIVSNLESAQQVLIVNITTNKGIVTKKIVR
ncbi:T9SS C-terminal target domain-containing protein [Flavobacterium arcticum]|uniref:T9SS C-terminal target domain-containing protein n=1 Tax=Flavobacterium arcticum TaxID=1784713 RepID=A0A345H875_9FLAO|nr:choice-of-anchor J domain-containing protein [Flavobacterium arcticum]AXG72785.1 T9SS C-terminal target domain-containing protein [Flavobacterium arcticum]KAF2510945.1 T9SS sorting signal type C domain-containing protein [Flavobacterium arcticum]